MFADHPTHRRPGLSRAWRGQCAALSLASFWAVAGAASDVGSSTIQLSERCPPSFEQTASGTCVLRSTYEQFGGVQGHGGTQVQLPPVRQGFSPAQIDLGRHLFFDPLLSADRKTSCAHCHHPDHGLSDGLRTAAGLGATGFGPARRGGHTLNRRTPTLWNVGFLERLFWDGRAASLEQQASGPLFSPDEMGNTPSALEAAINANTEYRRLFAQAFARPAAQRIVVDDVALALAAFQSTLISLNSRYDRYALGDTSALSAREIQGLNVFRGFVARCSQCHTPPLFTNNQLAVVGAPLPKGMPVDVGAGAFDPDPRLRGAFKVPTLRNITRSGPPYFHAGQLASLDDVVAFYNDRRGHALPRHEKQTVHWHVHMTSAQLSADDVKAVVSFLGALEDETMLPAAPPTVPSGLPVVPVRRSGRPPTSP